MIIGNNFGSALAKISLDQPRKSWNVASTLPQSRGKQRCEQTSVRISEASIGRSVLQKLSENLEDIRGEFCHIHLQHRLERREEQILKSRCVGRILGTNRANKNRNRFE